MTVLQESSALLEAMIKRGLSEVWTMADLQQRRFRLWPWKRANRGTKAPVVPPTTHALAEKLTELVHFERGVAALYYYLPDDALTHLAHRLCQAHESQNVVQQGGDRELHVKEVALASWRAVSAIWWSAVWQPEEILATFGFRMIELLRAQNDLWSIVVDPRAQCFGLAVANNETHHYWCVLVIGQRGQDMGSDAATAAR
jgi:hypothetical protein